MTLQDYDVWEMKPRKLTAEEVECPEKVIEEFFQYIHLPQARWLMWEGFKTLVTGGYAHLKSKEQTNMIYFFEQMERLVEGAHMIYERRLRNGA